jgi:hypothetical protein
MVKGSYYINNIKYKFKPFYVGFGSNERYRDHISEAKQKKYSNIGYYNWHKIHTIRKILNNGKYPIIKKIKENLSIDDAKKMEINIIKKLGTAYDKTGILTNLTKGGDGTFGVDHSGKNNTMFGKYGINNPNSFKYVANIDGKIEVFFGGKDKDKFNKKYKLSPTYFQYLVDGIKKHHRYIQIRKFKKDEDISGVVFLTKKEMKIIDENDKIRLNNIRKNNNHKIKLLITSPENIDYIVTNFSKFCKENKINRLYLRHVAQGKREHFLGWKCKYIN